MSLNKRGTAYLHELGMLQIYVRKEVKCITTLNIIRIIRNLNHTHFLLECTLAKVAIRSIFPSAILKSYWTVFYLRSNPQK